MIKYERISETQNHKLYLEQCVEGHEWYGTKTNLIWNVDQC